MHLPHFLDETLAGVGAVELVENLVNIVPGPVHPQVLQVEVFENLDEPARVVVIRVAEDHVLDDRVFL
ncbi:MAG: hypothetical protein QOD25_770 [Alphaproteobacteria bacterium]|nr:hypothetical protein [Alphaproteobacteria bacterium]